MFHVGKGVDAQHLDRQTFDFSRNDHFGIRTDVLGDVDVVAHVPPSEGPVGGLIALILAPAFSRAAGYDDEVHFILFVREGLGIDLNDFNRLGELNVGQILTACKHFLRHNGHAIGDLHDGQVVAAFEHVLHVFHIAGVQVGGREDL